MLWYERVLGPGPYFFIIIYFCRVSRNFELLTRKFDIVSRNFDLLTRKFYIGRIFELISRNIEIPYKIKKNMYLALILFRTLAINPKGVLSFVVMFS